MVLKPIIPARTPPAGKVLEKEMRGSIKRLLAACGFRVYDLEQGYRAEPGGTRQTRGLPDLLAYRAGIPVWAIQCKGWKTGHTETVEQVIYGKHHVASGGYYTCGTLWDVEDALVDLGLAVRDD